MTIILTVIYGPFVLIEDSKVRWALNFTDNDSLMTILGTFYRETPWEFLLNSFDEIVV